MLKHLTIRNYALIESLETEFNSGFLVITGETGAGKSIILGALGLILGQRADLQSLMDKNEKCIVEGLFSIQQLNLENFFTANNLDFDPEQSILRREILPSGKSRAFINDTPVNLNILKELAEKLIDIHSQNKVTLLQDESFQLSALDTFAGLDYQLNLYKSLFGEFTQMKLELAGLIRRESEAAREQEFYRFQFEELEAASLVKGEQEQLEEELKLLTHAGEIKTRLSEAGNLLEREQGALDLMKEIIAGLKPVKSYHSEIENVFGLFESTFYDLKEASNDIARVGERLEVEPARINELNNRLAIIYQLQQKHHTDSVEGLLAIKNDYRARLDAYTSLNDQINILKQCISDVFSKLVKQADEISHQRKMAKQPFEKEVISLISGLGMPLAQFIVELKTLPELTPAGREHAVFLFNANKGGEIQELAKVASGGELSRVLLAIKSILAAKKMLPSIIFDEIDSGVSGEVAGKMGSIMQMMAAKMQVIAITHIPQIAARGNYHFVVYKETSDTQTRTFIRNIHQEERIVEIAKMLSDTTITLPAMETAKELLKN